MSAPPRLFTVATTSARPVRWLKAVSLLVRSTEWAGVRSLAWSSTGPCGRAGKFCAAAGTANSNRRKTSTVIAAEAAIPLLCGEGSGTPALAGVTVVEVIGASGDVEIDLR